MSKHFALLLSSVMIAVAFSASGASAQSSQPQQPSQPPQTDQAQQQTPAQPQPRKLWIAKFTCETKAASAVAATQAGDTNALKYTSLFDTVTTFDADAKQPDGTWTLAANETDFSGGSAAARALVGMGAGRETITMEYTLTDPTGKAVWTQKIKTKPSFWGSAGQLGMVQNQGAATDEQAQKLIDALSKYFGVTPPKKGK
jgi:hypothetical protein